MRTSLRFASAALVAGLIGLSPASAQKREPVPEQPKPEAELKKAKEQLERLLLELRDQESKKSKPDAARSTPPAPPTPTIRPAAVTILANPNDPAIALKGLLASKDPKTAALAKELLAQLANSAPKPMNVELFLQLQGQPGAKPGQLEFKTVPGFEPKPAQTFEWKVAPLPAEELKSERRIVVVENKGGTATATATTVGGGSTLRLSSDGKTAAVVGGDGTVTIYDVASGKELMKFPGKK